jgi:hypothetical protein
MLLLTNSISDAYCTEIIKEIISPDNLIPVHQFGFRQDHSTIQQCHRIVNIIRDGLENKKVCAAVFLDIQQAFDKVWHQ